MRMLSLALGVVAAFVAAGCLPTPRAEQPTALPPVRIAVVIDQVGDWAAPEAAGLDPLVELVRRRGGELAVGVVSSEERPLARLRLEPPSQPRRTGNRIADRHERRQFEATAEATHEHARQTLSAFGAEVAALMALPRDGDSPWHALRQAATFLDEPGAAGGWLIYVGDRTGGPGCIDVYGAPDVKPGFTFTDERGVTYRCCPSGVWMREDAVGATCDSPADQVAVPPVPWIPQSGRILSVRTAAGAGPLDDFGALRFGSLEAAIRYVLEEEDEG